MYVLEDALDITQDELAKQAEGARQNINEYRTDKVLKILILIKNTPSYGASECFVFL